jgi:carboxylesterase type B
MPRSPEDSHIRRHIKGLPALMLLLYGSQRMQSGEGGSEDCLFLNIWTTYFSAHASSKQLKFVVFWIRGGAFTGGTANDPTFDGGNIASR